MSLSVGLTVAAEQSTVVPLAMQHAFFRMSVELEEVPVMQIMTFHTEAVCQLVLEAIHARVSLFSSSH